MDFSSLPNLFFNENEDRSFIKDKECKIEFDDISMNSDNSSSLTFLKKTKNVLLNYFSISSQKINQMHDGSFLNSKKVIEEEFFDFNSDADEEDLLTQADYIVLLSTEKHRMYCDRPKKFAMAEKKMKFLFNNYCSVNKLKLINSSLFKIFNKLVVLNKGKTCDSNLAKKIKVYECKICSKKFDDGRKLGGHMSKFHSKRRNE